MLRQIADHQTISFPLVGGAGQSQACLCWKAQVVSCIPWCRVRYMHLFIYCSPAHSTHCSESIWGGGGSGLQSQGGPSSACLLPEKKSWAFSLFHSDISKSWGEAKPNVRTQPHTQHIKSQSFCDYLSLNQKDLRISTTQSEDELQLPMLSVYSSLAQVEVLPVEVFLTILKPFCLSFVLCLMRLNACSHSLTRSIPTDPLPSQVRHWPSI